MTTIRAFCPQCDVIDVRVEAIELRHTIADEVLDARFDCPMCDGVVTQRVNRWVAESLVEAGCRVDDHDANVLAPPTAPSAGIRAGAHVHPAGAGHLDVHDGHPEGAVELTEAEISRFVARLDALDWFDELVD